MAHLKKQNEELGRLIHKDNKLIPAMETAVIDFLSANEQKENNTLGQSLVSQLKELSGSRRKSWMKFPLPVPIILPPVFLLWTPC